MSYTRKPVYYFSDMSSTGIDQVSDMRFIFVEDTGKLFLKLNNDGLTETTTLQEALDAKNLKDFLDIMEENQDFLTGSITRYMALGGE